MNLRTNISLQFCTGHGQFDTHKDTTHEYAGITYEEIVAMVSNPLSLDKSAAQWLIPSCYRENDARSHDAQRIRGQFGFLTVDVDQGNLSIDNVKEALKAVLGNCSLLIYSTRSATINDCKWRVLVPLKNLIAGADYSDTEVVFYDLLTDASKGILIPDRALARSGQLVYLPNRGAFYQHAITTAKRADLCADHPVVIRRDQTRAARARAETAARNWKAWKAQNAQITDSVIDAFNASTTVCDALAHYGYVQAGQSDDWRSPMQTSGSFATRANTDHWISLSGSDAAAGIGRDSKSGQRFGDAFDLFVHFEHRGDFQAAVRAHAEQSGQDYKNKARAENGSTAGSDFGTEHMPTPFVWRDPNAIPPRPWVYGHHLIRQQVSVTVAPGGVGKSSLTICEALCMTSGRNFLGDWTAQSLKVWLFNLEDPRDELNRRIVAAMQHHGVKPHEIAERLFVDTGRERALCTATQTREGVMIIAPVMASLATQIEAWGIDVLIVDPFVSSHQVNENDNGAIDLVAKEWARLADRCNCAIELVHHTRKLNGEDATTESGRGATALLAAARSGRVLNKMSQDQKMEAGIAADPATYFAITRDKANLAPAGKRVWRRMASVRLANGDDVGVVEAWEWPDTFSGMDSGDLLAVQNALDGKHARYSDQTGADWAGEIVAVVLGLNVDQDRKRIRKMIEAWLKSGALVKGQKEGPIRKTVPTVEVGQWARE